MNMKICFRGVWGNLTLSETHVHVHWISWYCFRVMFFPHEKT